MKELKTNRMEGNETTRTFMKGLCTVSRVVQTMMAGSRAFVIVILLVTLVVTGCGSGRTGGAEALPAVQYGEPLEAFEGFKEVADSEYLTLSINGTTTEIIVEDKRSGEKWYSNPPGRGDDTIASPDNIRKMSSQITITYHLNSAPKIMENYTESIERGQYNIYKADNGVKVVYTIGKAEKVKILPTVISEERFLNFINKIEDEEERASLKRKYKLYSLDLARSDEQREKMLRDYPKVSEYNVYVQNPEISEYMLLEMSETFMGIGYDIEEMKKDNEEHGILIELKEPETFVIPVEYRLERDSLKASVPLNEIRYNTKIFQLMRISLLEFFGSGGPDDEGYIFMPDGSGSLVNFNNGKSSYGSYVLPVYGNDRARNFTEYNQKDTQASFPVFGIKNGAGAYLATIDEGDMFANINASVSGRLNSQNNVYVDFDYLKSETLDLAIAAGNNVINMYQPRPYNGNYSVTYTFLNADSADYNGMALETQRQLEEKGLISRQEARGKYPFFMELVGAIDKKHTVMGISLDGTEALTSYDEAYKIIEESQRNGIDGVVLKYTGMLNGGVRHTPLSDTKAIGKLGGKSGLKALTKRLADEHIDFYADLDFQYVHDTALFDGFNEKKHSLRFINKDIARLYNYDLVARAAMENQKSRLMLSPTRYLWYAERMIKGFGKLNITGYSARSFGTGLNSAYEKDSFLDRSEVIGKTVEAFEKISASGTDIMLNGANMYLLAYSKDALNVSDDSSFHIMSDESIPFLQMVMRGYVEYAGEPVNLSDDPVRTFLKAAETGGGLYYLWFYADNSLVRRTDYNTLFSANYSGWLKHAAEQYKRLEKDFTPLQGVRITGHEEVSPEVVRVTYENGTQVIVNYSGASYRYHGIEIGARDYATIV